MYFDKVIIVGSGSIACTCLDEIRKYTESVRVIETADKGLSFLKNRTTSYDVPYEQVFRTREFNDRLLKLVSEKKTLIISANNELIFNKDVIEASTYKIINFHYGYLPDYRGMNIPTWVIYNEEKYTGITWHEVNARIDAGGIIDQVKIELKPYDRAFDIVKQVMKCGAESFSSFIKEYLQQPFVTKENDASKAIHIYKRSQLPNDGYFDENTPINEVMKLLRAYDYGNAVDGVELYFGEGLKVVGYRVYAKEVCVCESAARPKGIEDYVFQEDINEVKLFFKK